MHDDSYLADVRNQYETLPYPPRVAADEKRRLVETWLDRLAMINHYGSAGRQAFDRGFRALVAGGGTGDGTIFLAEQLRGTDATIVHLDLSAASIDIARQRAAVRGLENIQWLQHSILELPQLGLAPFDYINCSGVLHHLADPDAGLRALLGVLAADGVLGLMVYGQHGRTGVYQMQSLLRLIDAGGTAAHAGSDPNADLAPGARIARAREVLATAPRHNGFRLQAGLHNDHIALGDAGLYDLLLHSQDRAYTVGELYDWLVDTHGLRLHLTDVGRGNAAYQPARLVAPARPGYLARLAALPHRRQHEIAELLGGSLITHSLYATRRDDATAAYGDPDLVPFFAHEPVTGEELARLFEQHRNRPFAIAHAHSGLTLDLDPGRWGKYIVRQIDGARSFADIFARVRAIPKLQAEAPSDADLFADFAPLYAALNGIDRLLLRHRDCPFRGR